MNDRPQYPPMTVSGGRRPGPVGPPPLDGGTGPGTAEPTPTAGPPPPDATSPARSAGGSGGAGAPRRQPEGRSETELLRALVRERTADLQRLKAEYDNYRKRVRRDRLAVREIAAANVLGALLPVLDAVDAAREADQVSGGFQKVVEALESQLATVGLRSFGRAGETFDPTRHQALAYTRAAGVDRATCAVVHRSGYRVGDHLLRPAEVTVVDGPGQPSGGAG